MTICLHFIHSWALCKQVPSSPLLKLLNDPLKDPWDLFSSLHTWSLFSVSVLLTLPSTVKLCSHLLFGFLILPFSPHILHLLWSSCSYLCSLNSGAPQGSNFGLYLFLFCSCLGVFLSLPFISSTAYVLISVSSPDFFSNPILM